MKYNNPSFMAALTHSKQSYPLIGYRFHPTHEELIDDYLKSKMLGHDHDESVISEVDFCKYEPWELAKRYKTASKDNELYFLCRRDRKYKNKKSSLLNRTTAAGHWKPTGKPIPVKSKSTKKQIGTKRTLVFYKGRSNSKENRTGWIAHEYEWFPDSNLEIKGDYTLIKLKKKSNEKACVGAPDDHQMALSSNSDREPSDCMTYDYQYTTGMTADSTCNAAYDKGEPCSREALEDNNYDISCCIEGDQISPAAGTPPNKENDTSILDENSSSFSNSLPADDLVAAWLSKVSPELVAKIEAELKAMIEPECEFNSINQSSCAPKEAPSAMTMDPFVSSGCLLWNSAI